MARHSTKKQPPQKAFYSQPASAAAEFNVAALLDLPEINVRSAVDEKYRERYCARDGERHPSDIAWSKKSRQAMALILGYCAFPDCWECAVATHHVCYQRIGKDETTQLEIFIPIVGQEIPGIQVFPLCKRHHSEKDPNGAHHPDNWDKGNEPPPTLDAKNYPHYWKRLRSGWTEKRKWVEYLEQNEPEKLEELIQRKRRKPNAHTAKRKAS